MKWGLVLSGGGARGIAHVGLLKKLAAWDLRPAAVVGCSMGAIVGGAYACGMAPEEMERYLLEEFDMRRNLDSWVYQLTGGRLVRLLQAEDALHTLVRKRGIDSGSKVLELLRRLTADKDFSQTEIPFACNALDLLSGREVALDSGKVADAARASMAIPAVFTPVPREGMLLVDGGFADAAPAWLARRLGVRRLLVHRVSVFGPMEARKINNSFSVLARTFSVMAHALQERKPKERHVLELVSYDGSAALDFGRLAGMIRMGEETAEAEKRRILHHLGNRRLFRGGGAGGE
jgi:NTE family protein